MCEDRSFSGVHRGEAGGGEAMSEIWDEEVLTAPNWDDHIRHFFRPEDINCMSGRQIDLSTYYGVRLNADRIHFHTSRGSMPPDRDHQWSRNKIENFYNWMAGGYPEGKADFGIFRIEIPKSARVRRNARELENDGAALEKLKYAFRGLMEKPVDDPNGYYRLAGVHWLPAPALHCRHHENAYNPWHRAYLIAFENAMRMIEGCEDVTLPFWDIQDDYLPDFIWEEPFSYYEFPTDVADGNGTIRATKGDRTERHADLIQRIRDYRESPTAKGVSLGIDGYIEQALSAERWQGFNGWSGRVRRHEGIIRAHDIGHALCGTDRDPRNPSKENRSLATPNFAAFDPLFWFFHCNWDRLWWRWQKARDATSVDSFKGLADEPDDPTDWIDDPVVSMLQPFGVRVKDVIDSSACNIEYEQIGEDESAKPLISGFGHVSALSDISIALPGNYSVRIKGINRLAIPGSFFVELLVGSESIAKTYVFQSDEPEKCPSCVKSGLFSVDFVVGADYVNAAPFRVRITCLQVDGFKEIPIEKCGSPTVNIRALVR